MMASSTLEVLPKGNGLVVPLNDIQTLTEFYTDLMLAVKNQSPKSVYLKAIINDPSGNWTFDDGSTSKELGEAKGFSKSYFLPKLKRVTPSSPTEESFTLILEVYDSSTYSRKVDTITYPVNVYIDDFLANWNVVEHNNFDDGTTQGWTGWDGVTDEASIVAGGYSFYETGTADKWRTVSATKSITLPSGVNKILMGLYFAFKLWSGVNYNKAYFKEFNVYINDELYIAYHRSVYALNNTKRFGWYFIGTDISALAGQTVTIKVEYVAYYDDNYKTSSTIFMDEFFIVSK